MGELLQTQALTVAFGGLRALDGVNVAVGEGSLVGLIGANGAGKTTFIDAVTGFVPATGRVVLAGEDLGGCAPHQRVRSGLGRTWQATDLFDDLTVIENLQVAADRPSLLRSFGDLVRPERHAKHGAVHDSVETALELLGLRHLAARLPAELSHGERKLVGVARALAARPRLLCMDEPAAGLDTTEAAELGRRLRKVVASGVSVLLVDHDMGLVLEVCDQLYVLEFGRVIAQGTPAQVRTDERVVTSYLGAGSHRRLQ